MPSSIAMAANDSALVNGYSQSKWVAERLVMEAGRRGLPVTIHRPGRVLSSRCTGAANSDDLMTRFVIGCVQLECLPLGEGTGAEYGAPVDSVAAAVVALALESHRCSSFGQIYHPFEEEPTSHVALFAALGINYGLRVVDLDTWLGAVSSDPHNVAHPLLHELRQMQEPDLRMPVFDSRATVAALAKLGRQIGPSLDYAHACAQLDYLRGRHMLPPARRVAAPEDWLSQTLGVMFGKEQEVRPSLPEAVTSQSGETPFLCMACDDAECDFQPVEMFRRPIGKYDVSIKVLFCGVCHSDLTVAAAHLPTPVQYPMVPGHEAVGVVTQVGPGVHRFKVGDHAGVGNMVDSCSTCHSCLGGQEQWCSKQVPTYNGKDWSGRAAEGGGVQHTLGGYSTSMVVNERFCILVPSEYPLEHAGPVMCAGTTMYTPLKANCAKAGTQLGIVGLGGLGVMGIKLGKALGCEVTVISRGETKRSLAMRAGADRYLAATDAEDMAACAGCLDLIINTIPSDHDPSTFIPLLASTGQQVHVGLHAAAMTAGAVNFLLPGRTQERFTYIGGIASTQEVMDLCAREDIRTDIEMKSVADLNRIFEMLDSANESGKRFVLDIAGTLHGSVSTAPATRLQPGPASGEMLREVAGRLAVQLGSITPGEKVDGEQIEQSTNAGLASDESLEAAPSVALQDRGHDEERPLSCSAT